MFSAFSLGCFRAIYGAGKIPRWLFLLVVAMLVAANIEEDFIKFVLITLGLFIGLIPGHSLTIIYPYGPRDWYEKLPITKLFQIHKIKDLSLYAIAGMSIRFLAYAPVIMLAGYYKNELGVYTIISAIAAIHLAVSYSILAELFDDPAHANRVAEFYTLFIIGMLIFYG